MISVTAPPPQAGIPCPSCLCFSIMPLSSLFPQHLFITTNYVTLTSVFTRVLRSRGISTAVREALCQFPGVGPGLHDGSAPHAEESHQGFSSPPEKAPPLHGGEECPRRDSLWVLSSLQRVQSINRRGAWRGGRTASWGWADGHRSGFVHPRVWTSLGAERCGGRACSLMTMMTLRPSAQPLSYDRLVPTLCVPEHLLKRCAVDLTLTPSSAAHCPVCLCTGSIPTFEDPSPGNTGQKLRPRQEDCEGGSTAVGGIRPLLTSQNSLGSGHRLQVPRLSFPHRVSTVRGSLGGAHAPPHPGLDAQGARVLACGTDDVMLHGDSSRDEQSCNFRDKSTLLGRP